MNRIASVLAIAIAVLAPIDSRAWDGAAEKQARRQGPAYFGFGIGAGVGYEGYDLEEECTGPTYMFPLPALMLKMGMVVNPYFLLGPELNLSTLLLHNYLHFDLTAAIYPFQEWGFYIKTGIGLGYHNYYCGGPGGSAFGFDLRAATGYDFQLGESFNLGLEIANSIILTRDGYLTSTVGLLTFSWY